MNNPFLVSYARSPLRSPSSQMPHDHLQVLELRPNYFRYGSVLRVREKLDHFAYDRMRYFLVRRSKVRTRGNRHFPRVYVFGDLGVLSLKELPRSGTRESLL